MDALSDVLSAVRLTSNVFLDARFTEPWCVASHVGPEDCALLGVSPANVIAYHYVTAGDAVVELPDGPSISVRAGDIVLLPRNDRHALASAPGMTPTVIDHLVQAADGMRPAALDFGGGGRETHVVCGYLGCEVPGNPLIASLPPLLKVSVDEGSGTEWIAGCVTRAAGEFASGGVGSATVLSKLAELLFIEGVRRFLAALPEGQTGWLAGLRDRSVGRALALLHTHAAHPWTTEELAQKVGLSRSAFADRFTQMIGVPPMRYLTQWRLQFAAVRLRESSRSIVQVAFDVGYESEAAFSRAFKAAFGVSPGAWRKGEPATVATMA